MNQQRFEELCAAYALGALDPEEERELREALRDADPDRHAILRQYLDTAEKLPLSAEQSAPPAALKRKIMDNLPPKAGSDSTATPQHRQTGVNPWMRLAALILIAALLGLGLYTLNVQQQVDELEVVVEQQRLELLDMENKLEVTHKYLDLITSRQAQFAAMEGLDPSPEGFGRLFLDEATSTALLHVSRIPLNPADKDYQLWVIEEDQDPVSAGVFSLEEDRETQYVYIDDFVKDSLDQVALVAITLEPKGGMPQPTGDMYLLGSPVR